MRLIASVLALLLLAACQPAPEAGCARLPSAGQYCLQGSPGPHFETLQESVLSAGGQRHTLLTRLGNDETGLRFVALSPLGQTVFAVSWENGALHATLPEALAGRIDPALFPALIQIALWPDDAVRRGLSTELELHAEARGRQLRRTGTPDKNTEQTVLNITWEGELPYRRLRIEAPGALVIDARALDTAVSAAESERETP